MKKTMFALILLLLWSFAGISSASGTAAGTVITNGAAIGFDIEGVSQTPTNASPYSFTVDRKVDLTLTAMNSGYVTLIPGSVNYAATRFMLTNTGNAAQDYSLVASNYTTDPFGGTDSIDLTNLIARVSADATCDASDVSGAASVSSLAPDMGTFVCVFATVATSAANGNIAAVLLYAQTLELGGAALVQNLGVGDANVLETVFADGAGQTDMAHDAAYDQNNAFMIASASVACTKSGAIVSDPVDGTSNPKHIPGARVTYSIQCNNTGDKDASNVTITDPLPSNVTFVSGTLKLNGSSLTDGTGDDAGDFSAGAVHVSLPTLPASGGTTTATFDVTVN